MFKNKITFIVGKQQVKNLLKNLGNAVNEENFIIDSKTGNKVISQDEGEITLEELGSISSGSTVFIKKNIASYSEFLSQKRKG